ncbi:uncharacterized protein TNCV_1778671 [Trichonephila clavipes]|nr:uncharacterized protein TNCV_1778671 [Trichonephila clavipes]
MRLGRKKKLRTPVINSSRKLDACVKAKVQGDQGLGSNLGEGMDVCKCIVPLRHGGTLDSRQASRPLVRLVEEEESWEASGHAKGFLPLNRGGTEQTPAVPCLVLKAKANDRRKNSSP